MRNRASLILMELLAMILVFSVAAAMCLQVFVKAKEISENTVRLQEAALTAQSTAEILKATAGDTACGESAAGKDFRLEITEIPAGIPGLKKVRIDVYEDQEENLIFSLETGWQEGIS